MLTISRVNQLPSNTTGLIPGSRFILPNGKEFVLNNLSEFVPIHMMALEIKGNLGTENLNTIETYGIYFQKSNANTEGNKNYPTTSAGTLRVYATDDAVYQEYTVLSGQINENKTYIRGKYIGVWSEWKSPLYITQQQWDNFVAQAHTHTNKSILDSIGTQEITKWNSSLYNNGAFVDNINAADNSRSTSLWAIETANGSGNTNFPVNSTYGNYIRFKSNSFTTDFVAHNTDTFFFKTFFHGTENGTNTPWKRVWSDADFTNDSLNHWNLAYSWGNHATFGYLKLSDANEKYVPFEGYSQIDGNIIIIDTKNEDTSVNGTKTSKTELSFNTVNVSGFGINSSLEDNNELDYWFGYSDKDNVGPVGLPGDGPIGGRIINELKFITFDLDTSKFTIGEDTPIYLNQLNLGTVNAIGTLTIDAAGKMGVINGTPLTSFTETDPTVPAHVKGIGYQQIVNWDTLHNNFVGYIDDRIIEPNAIGVQKLQFGFTSWNNDNSAPWADFIHLGGYGDTSGQKQNLLSFNKQTFGIRQYQQTSQAASAYSSYVDYWHSGNLPKSTIDGLNDVVTKSGAQIITGIKEFNNGFTVNGYKQYSDITKGLIVNGPDAFNNNYTNIIDTAIGIGVGIFPSFNVQPYKGDAEIWNNKGYVAVGKDIFVNYTGNTDYRPGHNAHDSWVGFGRALASGFVDGTNLQMFGTANLHRNDVKYADSITIIGKGNTNGVTADGTVLSPSRVVSSVNGLNLRDMMTDVIMIGHENWIEDIHSSVILGSNTRPYGYVFNSLILGSNNTNWGVIFDPGKPKVNLDSDIIIGSSNWKRHPRHPLSHNLLVGMDYSYSTGGAPNPLYRSLIEGVFKNDIKLQVNGQLIAAHAALGTDLPNEVAVPYTPTGMGAGVSFNAATNEITFTGASSNASITIKSFPIDLESSYFIRIESTSSVNVGTWGYEGLGTGDSGNGVTWVHQQPYVFYEDSTFKFTTQGAFKGVIKISIFKTELNGQGSLPNFIMKDSKEVITFESRSGISGTNNLIQGINSGKYLSRGSNVLVLGNDSYSHTTYGQNSILIGNKVAKLNTFSNNEVIIGHNSLSNSLKGSGGNVFIGNDIAIKPGERITLNVSSGTGSLIALNSGTTNTVSGTSAANTLVDGSNNLIMGGYSGRFKFGNNNVFLGHVAGGYNITNSTFNNTIVIGANAAPEVPNNTVTIATASNTDNFLYGTTHSNSFKVRGGLATQIMMADGTLKDQSTLLNIGNYATQTWVNDTFIPKTHPVNNITQTNINSWNNKVSVLENAIGLGFSNGNVNDVPYIYHSAGTYSFLATQVWSNNTFIPKTHIANQITSTHVTNWDSALINRGAFTSNVNVADASRPTGYYANETPNGTGNTNFPQGGYGTFQRIKTNTFTTDIAAFNHDGLYFKTFYHPVENGTATPWNRVWTNKDFEISNYTQKTYVDNNFVDLYSNQSITGIKTFNTGLRTNTDVKFYDSVNNGYGSIALGDDIYTFKNYSNTLLFQYDSGQFFIKNGGGTNYGVFDFNAVTGTNKFFTLPNKSGTVALISDLPSTANFALNTGSNASNTWQNDSFGLTMNPTISGKTLNASGQNVYLRDATYGSVAGILQDDSTNSPIAGSWTNRLKILHNNSAGYYTELAHSFTGAEGVWHRRNVAGTVSPWRKLYDSTDFSISNYDTASVANGKYVSLTNSQNISGSKYFNNITTFQGATGNEYNQTSIVVNGGGGTSTTYPAIGFHQPGAYAGILLLQDSVFSFYSQGLAGFLPVKASSFVRQNGTATQIMMADGSVKEQSTISGTTYTAGTGISISGNTITNSSPNIKQTLSISGSVITLSNGGGSVTVPSGSSVTAGTNIGISGSTVSVVAAPTFSGNVTAASFLESSLKKYKTNIKPFKKCGLKMIRELDIVTFDRIDGVKNKIGIIADNTKKEFLSEDLDAVDLYKTVFIQAKAIQELEKKNNRLEEELNNLRELVMSKLNQL